MASEALIKSLDRFQHILDCSLLRIHYKKVSMLILWNFFLIVIIFGSLFKYQLYWWWILVFFSFFEKSIPKLNFATHPDRSSINFYIRSCLISWNNWERFNTFQWDLWKKLLYNVSHICRLVPKRLLRDRSTHSSEIHYRPIYFKQIDDSEFCWGSLLFLFLFVWQEWELLFADWLRKTNFSLLACRWFPNTKKNHWKRQHGLSVKKTNVYKL